MSIELSGSLLTLATIRTIALELTTTILTVDILDNLINPALLSLDNKLDDDQLE